MSDFPVRRVSELKYHDRVLYRGHEWEVRGIRPDGSRYMVRQVVEDFDLELTGDRRVRVICWPDKESDEVR